MRSLKYYAMNIIELKAALDALYMSVANSAEEKRELMMEMNCCESILEDKEIGLLISLKR